MNKKKILSVLFASVLALSPIGVKASTIYATNEDGSKNYTSINSAWDAAESGVKIVMQQDWNLSSRLVLESNKTATIEMNGHKISRNLTSEKTNGEVIKMCSDSTLNLNGKNAPSTYFSFKGYSDGLSANCATTSGGLITGGYSSNGAGAIHMKGNCKLNLDTVSISGNKSNRSWGSDGHGGAIYMDSESNSVSMKNAEITFNAAQRDGGGIYVNGAKSQITMENSYIVNNTAGASLSDLDDDSSCGGGIAIKDNDVSITMTSGSKIDDNFAHGYGGGVYSNGKSTKVKLDASSISFNKSDNNGGAIYFNYSNFEVVSENHDSQISHNSALSLDWGGAIYAARCTFSSNSGKIDGITFDDNSSQIGGALNVHQENVKVSNCTFTNNTAQSGGAISVNNDGFTLENSTVQNNTTTASYSAAVNVDGYNDINLNGTINITQNTNTESGTDADLILTEMGISNAYIVSAPDASSRIGLYIKEDRTLAKNQNSYAPNIYFVNNSNDYEISYDDSSKEITSKISSGGASSDWEEPQNTNHTLTINMVNESGTWQSTQKMSINEDEALELQAPVVEDKEFVEFKDIPDTLTVENDVVKADSVSEDLEFTLVYSDSESEESTDTASIFGDGNTVIAAVIIVGIALVGAFIFIKKKKKEK